MTYEITLEIISTAIIIHENHFFEDKPDNFIFLHENRLFFHKIINQVLLEMQPFGFYGRTIFDISTIEERMT